MSAVAERSVPPCTSSASERRPPPVSTTSDPWSPSPSRTATQARHRAPFPLISAMPPSALRSSMVQSAPSVPGRSVMSPSAPMPRWRSQTARANPAPGAGAPSSAASDEEVVPRGVELAEPDRHRLHNASREGATAQGLSAAASHVTLGSRRNHMRWRRAKDRVRRLMAPNASSRLLEPPQVLEHLPVADGLAGVARQAGLIRQRRHLVDQTGPSHRRDPSLDPLGEDAPGQPDPDQVHREGRRPERGRPGAERRERLTGEADRPPARATMRRALWGSIFAAAAGSRRSSSA